MNAYNDTDFNQRTPDLVSEILLLAAKFSKSLICNNFQDYLHPKLQSLRVCFGVRLKTYDTTQYKDSVLKNWKSEGKHRKESIDEGDSEEKLKVPLGN